jgi:hypothetical protein
MFLQECTEARGCRGKNAEPLLLTDDLGKTEHVAITDVGSPPRGFADGLERMVAVDG